jgi:predicted nucleic acid-binding protein
MNVVDSSGWLEYFADGPNAGFFAPAIENLHELVVPSITIYEVFMRVLQQRGEEAALQAAGAMMQGLVVDLDSTIALNAARIPIQVGLPMADSTVLASARAYDAVLWTQGADFKDLEDVCYIEKTRG